MTSKPNYETEPISTKELTFM
ncbi:unnamed protein product, partial [Rotaria sp. Silwood1]